ncbi:leucine-rich repeat domain-containing protein [Enhygromyxa salina]|uniref:Internalin-A n=1 Tax=Enhygromyxa salina TaxID=215803 RepID=A0A2S9YMH0_9BACT|nr:leucine-rich repeat domain-containing protein [Enhygromyxa salina]PRQ06283.1 Internalin-A precursor [Enhygromyxa salina]
MNHPFADPRLELAVRAALPQDVLAQPLRSLTRLDAAALGIRRLLGIEALSELRWLDLSRNPLSSLVDLRANTKLIRLLLRQTGIASLAGLEGLPELEDLDLSGAQVIDIQAIEGLPSLRSLDLGLCLVKRLSALATLARLESLTLGNPTLALGRSFFARPQPIELDLSPLRALGRLRQLRLYGLSMRSAASLDALLGLEELVLDRCTFEDRLREFPLLARLEVLSLSDCDVSALRVLTRLPRLRVLCLDEAEISDLSPLLGCEALESVSLRDVKLNKRGSIDQLRRHPRLAQLRLDNQLVELRDRK